MLHFGVSRRHGGEHLDERAQAFASALSGPLQAEIRVLVADDYEALGVALREGAADLAWLPPLVYSRSEALHLAALPERGGSVGYRAAILVRRDSPARSLSELRDARAAWVDPSSASGYAFPRQELLAAGATLSAESFHGNAHDAARAVVEGRADVCACYVGARDYARAALSLRNLLGELAAELRALSVTEEIPPDALVVRASENEQRIVSALLTMHESLTGLAALQGLLHADRLVAPAK